MAPDREALLQEVASSSGAWGTPDTVYPSSTPAARVTSIAELLVTGMTCTGCQGSVEKAIRGVRSVRTVEVSLVTGRVRVQFDGGREQEVLRAIVAAVDESGFEVESSEVVGDVAGDNAMVEITAQVEGVECAGNKAVSLIETVLRSLRGVRSVHFVPDANEVQVSGDNAELEAGDVIAALERAGFSARITAVDMQNSFPTQELKINVGGMTCSACQGSVERILASLEGVQSAAVSLIEGKAKVRYLTHVTGPREILGAVEDAGFDASLVTAGLRGEGSGPNDEVRQWYVLFIRSLAFSVPLFILSKVVPFLSPRHDFLMVLVFGFPLHELAKFALATPIQFWVGRRFYQGAWKALKNGSANMDVLVVLGTTAAYAYSVLSILFHHVNQHHLNKHYTPTDFFETSGLLITFICLGKYLETSAKTKTSEAITKLVELTPDTAILVKVDVDGNTHEEEEILAAMIHVGDMLKVLPGAKVPADGRVRHGISYVDESMITGESIPVQKNSGNEVIGGTVNTSGMLVVEATKVGSETALSQIIKLVESAQMTKAPVQLYADLLSSYFVPIVVALAVVTFFGWYGVGHLGGYPASWVPMGHNYFFFSLTFAISVVVAACPCALGLATPTAIMVGTGIGATNGVLIKGGEALETASRIDSLVFDKTGTLTHGKPSVTDVLHLHKRVSDKEIFVLTASAESGSEHPLGRAVVHHATSRLFGYPAVSDGEDQHFAVQFVTPEDVEAKPGFGIQCTVNRAEHLRFMKKYKLVSKMLSRDERIQIAVGNRRLMEEVGTEVPDYVEAWMQSNEESGCTCILVAIGGTLVQSLAISDPVKEEAQAVVASLEAMGIGCAMASGDNWRTAKAIGHQVGIRAIHAGITPEGKVNVIRELQSKGAVVAMVGDGINDSPGLVAADVGVAIGSGTDIAIEAADYVLMRSNLKDLILAIDLSKKTFKRIQANYVWATVYNIVCIPLAAGLLYPYMHMQFPPWVAGAAMAMSSVSVVCSSLLLRTYKRPTLARQAATADAQREAFLEL